MRIILLQSAIENLQSDRNRAQVRELLRGVSPEPPTLIVLPELFSTGAIPEGFGATEAAAIARADRALLAECAQSAQAFVLGGMVDAGGENLVNLSQLFDPTGASVCAYRKLHPFSMGGEDRVFQPGNAAVTYGLEGFVLQPAICYDLRFPELFRAGQRRGATLMTVQANWPASRQTHWEVLLRARAIENQCFVAGVNCVGTQGGIRYAGGSTLVSPKGEVLAELGSEAGTVSGEATPQAVAAWRKAFPVSKDRKSEEFWQ